MSPNKQQKKITEARQKQKSEIEGKRKAQLTAAVPNIEGAKCKAWKRDKFCQQPEGVRM